MMIPFSCRPIYVAIIATLLVTSCKKQADDGIDPATKNSISIEFENRVGDQRLVLGTPAYKNAAGETFAITALNYFVSNISLKNEDGTIHKFPNQYFLVRQVDAKSQVITLNDVPSGNYRELAFTIGVDSLKSVSPVAERVGALDVTSYGEDGMYWSWNSGYIFFKLEGTSTAVTKSVNANQAFAVHVGGYGGGWNGSAKTVNNLRTVSIPMPTAATVRGNIAPQVHVFVDALEVFNGPNKISLATTNSVHSPTVATAIAENFKAMFQVDHVHNNNP
ncbi:hypothetical protein GCM10028805_57800 [Spirosoma harenae]